MILILILNRILILTKLCETTPNLVGIFSMYCITFVNGFHAEILILILILNRILILTKLRETTPNLMGIFGM